MSSSTIRCIRTLRSFLIFLLNDISDTIKAEKEKALKDKLAAQHVQHGSMNGGMGGGGVPHAVKKSGFAALFSQSSSAPSSPAPTHTSLFVNDLVAMARREGEVDRWSGIYVLG